MRKYSSKRTSDRVHGRQAIPGTGGTFDPQARVAALEKKRKRGELTPAEGVALRRLQQVTPPDDEAEIRRLLGLSKKENGR